MKILALDLGKFKTVACIYVDGDAEFITMHTDRGVFAKLDDPDTFFRLQSIPGIGRILALTMLYEIHDIRRFPTVGQFLWYSRLVKGTNESGGKQYKPFGRRIGNPHLKWAFAWRKSKTSSWLMIHQRGLASG